MKKKAISWLLSFLMVFAMIPTMVFASDTLQITLTSDKNEVNVGDTVNFEVKLSDVSELGSGSFELSIPDGMEYIAGSGKTPDGLAAALGMNAADWTENIITWSCYGNINGYATTNDVVLLTFSCKINGEIESNHAF